MIYRLNKRKNVCPEAQPEFFQGRGGFVELGYFDKLFDKNTRKKALQGDTLELILLDQGTFFDFLRRAREVSLSPTLHFSLL